jgi:ABC-type Zn uptake system ZnuABC Zn-binding protein ZnuA
MSRGISMLDVPTRQVDRSMGDVHAAGNPHYALDPANGKIMAANIADVLSKVDPENKSYYQANLQKFNERLDQKIGEWTKLMEPYRGTKMVTYHKSYDYFAKRFGLEIVGQIEPKPGIEPSATHISALVGRVKGEGAKLVVIEPNRPHRAPQYVADAIGGKLLILPLMVGGDDKIKTYFDLFDYDIAKLTNALKAKQ